MPLTIPSHSNRFHLPNPLAGVKADDKQNLLNKNKKFKLDSSFHQVEISIITAQTSLASMGIFP